MTQSYIARLRFRRWPLALFGLVMLWPAVINRSPFLFPDTTAYIRAVDTALVKVVGHRTSWSNGDVLRAASVKPIANEQDSQSATSVVTKPVLLGRSIFYGMLAFIGVMAGTLWVSVILQALLVGAVIVALARHVSSPSDEHFVKVVMFWTLALATTPLAWFTSMVMPDFLTGLAVVAAAVLVVGWQRETRNGRLFWAGIAAYAALAHSSHVLLLLLLATVALVVGFVKMPSWRPGAATLAAAALLGLLGENVFVVAVTHATEAAPIRPPFITARLVDDGPGTVYLNNHCPETEFVLCHYRDRLPMASDTFLWGEKDGVFKSLPVTEQRRLADEQGAFVRAVILDQPLAVLGTSFDAAVRQFGAWHLSEFNYNRNDAASLADRVPRRERSELLASRAFQQTMPTTISTAFIVLWTLAGLMAIALAWRRRWVWQSWFGTALAIGWMVNTGLCGILSTPHDRYQTRVIWVMALAVLVIIPAARHRERRDPQLLR